MDTPPVMTPPHVINPQHGAGSSHIRQHNIVDQLRADRAQRRAAREGAFSGGNQGATPLAMWNNWKTQGASGLGNFGAQVQGLLSHLFGGNGS